MYLSEIKLDLFDRGNMKTLADIYRTHQLVMAGFRASSRQESCVLYRVEHSIRNGRALATILVQSTREPDWSELEGTTFQAQTKEFNLDFSNNQRLRFRLLINPVVTRDGKRRGLIRDEALHDWLKKRENSIGATFESFTAIDEGYFSGNKQKNGKQDRIIIKKARFEGILRAVEPNALRTAVKVGIGPAKAFGCGLLSLARPRQP